MTANTVLLFVIATILSRFGYTANRGVVNLFRIAKGIDERKRFKGKKTCGFPFPLKIPSSRVAARALARTVPH